MSRIKCILYEVDLATGHGDFVTLTGEDSLERPMSERTLQMFTMLRDKHMNGEDTQLSGFVVESFKQSAEFFND